MQAKKSLGDAHQHPMSHIDGKTLLYALACALGPYLSAALLVLIGRL
jgi:hypothetical protein